MTTKQASLRYPFVGVDGEGGGIDELGRQNYLLLRAGDELLFNHNKPLTTFECLEMLSNLPPKQTYVAYYFDYDVTMILRDLNSTERELVLRPRGEESHIGQHDYHPFAFYGPFSIQYQAKRSFAVKHENNQHWVTISDVGSFFQCTFLKALEQWEVGTAEERTAIKQGKDARKTFELMTEQEILYNELECRLLAEMMEKFRDVCRSSGYVPSRWQGPGWLAQRMMTVHNVVRNKELYLPEKLLPVANMAYYGGRSELLKIGNVQNVYEYDINSAYPAAMLDLPCLSHGEWRFTPNGQRPDGDYFVSHVVYDHPRDRHWMLCNLPYRNPKDHTISWRRKGSGTYWSNELGAAMLAGTEIKAWQGSWNYYRDCNCCPFDFIKRMYAVRQSIGKSTKGFALKLGLNSLYGKTAQSIGHPTFANPIWAGLITAHTRAMLIHAYANIDARNVVMMATDGLYTTEKLPVTIGSELGQWESKLHERMFFVQPGLYYGAFRAKTRGVSIAVLSKYENVFRTAFDEWCHNGLNLIGEPIDYPKVSIPIHSFISMRLAQAWGKPDKAGRWEDVVRQISFDWRNKRIFDCWEGSKGFEHANTHTRLGRYEDRSDSYGRRIGAWRFDEFVMSELMTAQPDYVELTETIE